MGWFKSTATFSELDGSRRKTHIRPRYAMPSKTLFLVLVLVTGCLWAQEQKKETPPPPAAGATTTEPAAPHPATITAEDKARKNPVKFTEVSVDRGKKIYGTQCALCHGDKGDGKGGLAVDMKLTMPDFTKPDTLKDRTDGELFAIIGAGRDPMPAQAGRMTDERRWNLVNYLRAVSGKVPEKSTGKEPEENIILVPQK
jgi:mono/diheme cytochrome c family protein